MSTAVLVAMLLFFIVSLAAASVALFIAWTRAEREAEQLRQRLTDLRARRRGLG